MTKPLVQKQYERAAELKVTFKLYFEKIECFISEFYEYQTTQINVAGLKLSDPVLFDAVVHYHRDLERYKRDHDITLANDAKKGAFTAFWLAEKCPIFDTQGNVYAAMVNVDFAIFAAMTIACVNPFDARTLANGDIYKHLKSILSTRRATPDALVPLFEALQLLAPVSPAQAKPN